jgi:hypothetical protein
VSSAIFAFVNFIAHDLNWEAYGKHGSYFRRPTVTI